jgi:hypothetical protein
MNNFYFYNFPKKYSLADYDLARNEFISVLSDVKSVKCLVEFGTVTAPGVSDLDFIVVINDDAIIPKKIINTAIKKGKLREFVKDGTILTLPETLFKEIRKIDKFGSFNFLLGQEIKTKEPDVFYKTGLDLVCLIDWLPERLMRINSLLNCKSIDVVYALCLLHSVKYSIKNMEKKYGQKFVKSDEFCSTVEIMRVQWDTITNPTELLFNTIKLGVQILIQALEILSSNFSLNVIDELDSVRKLPKFNQIPFHKSLEIKFSNSEQKTLDNEILIPKILSYHYWFLSSIDCELSNHIRRSIGITREQRFDKINEINTPYFNALVKKMFLLNYNYDLIKKNKMLTGMLRYGNYVNLTK